MADLRVKEVLVGSRKQRIIMHKQHATGPGKCHLGNPRSKVQLLAILEPKYLCLFFYCGAAIAGITLTFLMIFGRWWRIGISEYPQIVRLIDSETIIMKQSVQDNSGLKVILTIPWLYELFQNLAGAKIFRAWLAKNIWNLNGREKVIDMGCGPGVILEYLPDNIEYWGFDISENYIKAACKKFPHRGTFLVGTARDFQNDSRLNMADLVICNGLLHHLNDDEAIEVLKLSKKIMKSNGRLVCCEPTFLAHQTWFSRWIISKDRGRYVRSEREWKDLINKVFESYSTNVVTGLARLPYIHIIMECCSV